MSQPNVPPPTPPEGRPPAAKRVEQVVIVEQAQPQRSTGRLILWPFRKLSQGCLWLIGVIIAQVIRSIIAFIISLLLSIVLVIVLGIFTMAYIDSNYDVAQALSLTLERITAFFGG